MSRYQNQPGNATSHGINTLLCTLLFFLLWPALARAQAGLSEPPRAQSLLLLPAEPTQVNLHTHTADFQISVEGGNVALTLNALYRLKNNTKEPVNLTLKMVTASGIPVADLPPSLELTLDNAPTGPLFTDNYGYTVQAALGSDERVDLRLNYTIILTDTLLTTLWYDPAPLAAWVPSSLRVSFILPASLDKSSWLQVAPDGWRFTQTENTREPLLRWLYDNQLPKQPFVFQFIPPLTWQQLQQAQASATTGAPTANYVTLGNLYQQLYQATTGALRDRFYAQALAAYGAGVTNTEAVNAPPTERAPLHLGLARLYRQRAIAADGAVNQEYMSLMASAAALALAGLSTDAPERQELLQWQVESLTLALNAARDRRDWQSAFQTLDQLAALPPDAINPAVVAENRRAIKVQQALDFLAEGNQNAARALAGPAIQAEELQPPPNARTLFTNWQVTMTIQPAATDLTFVALPSPEQQAVAESALATLIEQWRGSGLPADFTVEWSQLAAVAAGGPAPLRLQVNLPAGASGQALVNALPIGANWALLRALLAQISPQIDQQAGLLRQTVRINQPLEVRGVGEEWLATANTLEIEANRLEAQSPALNLTNTDAASAETALRVRIQAANYRHTAQQWRTLARTSFIRATLSAPIGWQTMSRSWLATVETPTQVLELQAEAASLSRLLGGVLFTLLGLFMVSGVLWWLL